MSLGVLYWVLLYLVVSSRVPVVLLSNPGILYIYLLIDNLANLYTLGIMGRITGQDIIMPGVYIADMVMRTGNILCSVLVRVRRERAIVIYKSSSREHMVKVSTSMAPRTSCQTMVPALELVPASLFMFIPALLVEFMALASVA
jgi:hypothetical protein